MFKILLLIFVLFLSLKVNAECIPEDLFDGKASVEITKPTNFFSGTPKPSPEIIDKAKLLAKQNALDKFVMKCITDRNKIDRYSLVSDTLKSKVDSIVNIERSQENQKDLTFNISIRASVNASIFESLLFGQGRNAKSANSGSKKLKRMVSFFIARKATSTNTDIYDNKVSKINKTEVGAGAEKSATTDGTTTVINNQASGFIKSQSGGSTKIKRRSSEKKWTIISSEKVNKTIQKTLADNGYRGTRYPSFAKACGAPPSDVIREDFVAYDRLTDDTEAEIFDAISSTERCERNFGFVTIGTLNVNTAIRSKVTNNPTVSVEVRIDISQMIDGFPEVVAAIGPILVRGQGMEESDAETNALSEAGKVAAQEIVNSMKAQGL
tara:strand:+ start:46 stop:1188 length:1143 start_codon:yes stop_codon:yes gene_type:complete